MNKREFRRLESWEQRRVMEQAAKRIDSKLNLFGAETVGELIDAALDGAQAVDAYIANLLTPAPHFDRAFCTAARPACNQFARYARYWRGE